MVDKYWQTKAAHLLDGIQLGLVDDKHKGFLLNMSIRKSKPTDKQLYYLEGLMEDVKKHPVYVGESLRLKNIRRKQQKTKVKSLTQARLKPHQSIIDDLMDRIRRSPDSITHPQGKSLVCPNCDALMIRYKHGSVERIICSNRRCDIVYERKVFEKVNNC